MALKGHHAPAAWIAEASVVARTRSSPAASSQLAGVLMAVTPTTAPVAGAQGNYPSTKGPLRASI